MKLIENLFFRYKKIVPLDGDTGRSGMYHSTCREAPPNHRTGEGDAVEVSVRL